MDSLKLLNQDQSTKKKLKETMKKPEPKKTTDSIKSEIAAAIE
jgi:hypothetical protein